MKRRGASVIEVIVILMIIGIISTLIFPVMFGKDHVGKFVCLKTFQSYGEINENYVTLEDDEGILTCKCSITDYGQFIENRKYVVSYRGERVSWVNPWVLSLEEID